jgi:acetyl esterase/lipase
MSQDTQQDHISKKKVLYAMPGTDAVTVRKNVVYRAIDAGELTMDLYYPPDSKDDARAPAVIMVTGYPDIGARKMLGCNFNEMESFVSWGRLMAASGLVAVTYTNREPTADVRAMLEHVRQNAAALGIDENRIGVWSCSGHAPTALSLLMPGGQDFLKCAVLCYPYTLDLDGSTLVADAATRWGFVDACAGKSVDDLPREIPLFIARAGQDQMPGLNEALDRFVGKTLACNLPVTVVNHAAAPHAFDLFHDSDTTREIIKSILGFLQFHLLDERSA